MSDVFENVAAKYKGTPSALILFVAGFAMLVLGINHFAEDAYSSYAGLISVESHFRLNVQVWSWTYWTMSLAPQIASVVFFYVYLANTDKKSALAISAGAQIVDFLSDLWFRSNGSAFTDWGATVVSALLTLAYFTVGSEVFLSFGAGLCLKLAAPALSYWKLFWRGVRNAKKGANEDRQEDRYPQTQRQPFPAKFVGKQGGGKPGFNYQRKQTHLEIPEEELGDLPWRTK